ncbi:hypothetical protein [Gellertiella hungarica]|uniref:Uncharacterized protein n=1 Tax=Gellertiella hungarica TaxID=1572859 RepID=A0A7W6J547_9HYPH|nr:hypothetical protein [Gellertiella hungarica]MBB4064068.1 hypothetical protein [Gellertiella hungarica]
MEAALAELKAAIEEEGHAPTGALLGIITDAYGTHALGWVGPEDVIEAIQYEDGLNWDCPEWSAWAKETAKEIAADVAWRYEVDWSELNREIVSRFDDAAIEKGMPSIESA